MSRLLGLGRRQPVYINDTYFGLNQITCSDSEAIIPLLRTVQCGEAVSHNSTYVTCLLRT